MHFRNGTRPCARGLGGVLLLLALGGATLDDRDIAVRTLARQDAALLDVGERLAIAALPLCRNRGWAAGMVIQTRAAFGDDYRDAATRVLGVGDRPAITHIRTGGAAARAGLTAGDAILAIDGVPTASERARSAATTAATDAALAALDRGLADGVADLQVRRGGRDTVVRLRADPACRARFEVRAGSETNASADDLRVQVSSDLVDPDRRDADLAPLVAHELAHIVLGHDKALERYRGGLLPGFGRGGRALRDSETAADRLSVYLLALAGYRPDDAIDFWARFGRRTDAGILSDRTHPGWKDRVAAIRAEVARIAAQRAVGQPPTPPADLVRPMPSG